jgi:diguanylate cyclase (GGDEF)-like protein
VNTRLDSAAHDRGRRELETSIASAIYAVTRAQFVRVHTLVEMNGETLSIVSSQVDGTGVYWTTSHGAGGEWAVSAELLSDHPLMAKVVKYNVPVRKLESATGLHLCYYPVCLHGKVAGIVELKENHQPYHDEDELISEFIALHINYMHWLDGSDQDPLTGALRQNLLLPCMRKSLSDVTPREGVQGCGQCLVLLSIDHFAAIVQCYGKLFGDEILRRVAHELRQRLGKGVKSFFFEPDGFAVLQPAKASRLVELWFTDFLEHMATIEFPNIGQPLISVGLSQLSPGDTPECVIERATRALAKAKLQNPREINRPGAR